MMGIVHHSNYLRLCEEARVAWCKKNNLIDASLKSVFSLTVYETLVRHLAPVRYGDHLVIDLQARVDKAKLILQYRLHTTQKIVAVVQTIHCSLDQTFKVVRLDKKFSDITRKEKWTETWL